MQSGTAEVKWHAARGLNLKGASPVGRENISSNDSNRIGPGHFGRTNLKAASATPVVKGPWPVTA